MLYLVLPILSSTTIIITFKLFERFRINILPAITINYLIASLSGFLLAPGDFTLLELVDREWFFMALIVGITLIIGFNLFALNTKYNGVAVTAIASRMSVVIPVILGFLLFKDTVSGLKILGIILALVAFYLTFKKGSVKIDPIYVYLPILLFFTIGINDSLIKVAQHYFIGDDYILFLATAFSVALILGVVLQLFQFKTQKFKFNFRNIIAGIILGTLNWWTTYLFLKGLSIYDVSYFVPIYFIGIVVLSSIVGYFVFKEELKAHNWLGIAFAVIAIILIASS